MVKALGSDQVHVESDSLLAMDLVKKEVQGQRSSMPVVEDVASALLSLRNFRISHTYRECNSIADWLARSGSTEGQMLKLWHSPPVQILPILNKEAICLRFLSFS